MNERYLLTNVRLEQGFIRRQGVVQGTECAEFTLDIICLLYTSDAADD